MNCVCNPEYNPQIPSNQSNAYCNAETCTNQQFGSVSIQPQHQIPVSYLVPLNQMGIKYAGGYTKTPDGKYVTKNPLTFDAMRGLRMELDRPHYTGSVDDVYASEYTQYGSDYTNYMDMNTGQIQYHINTATKNPYSTPVFTTPAVVGKVQFVDPNGIVKPEYPRQAPLDWSSKNPVDSFTHDTLTFREDLIARQQRKNNQSNWMYRWADNVL